MDLSSLVRFVKGVGEKRERAFLRMGVKTVEDLLFFFPRRYEDRRDITPLSALTAGSMASVVAQVVSFEKHPTSRQGLEISSVLLSDGESVVKAVWFNLRRLEDVLVPGVRVALYGKVEMRPGPQLTNPEFEVLDESDPDSVGRIVPIYPATAGLSPKWVRRVVFLALELYLPEVRDFVPLEIRERHKFQGLRESMMELHRPQGRESWLRARNRLAFDELFLLQTGLLLRKKRRASGRKIFGPLRPGEKFQSFWSSLPFQLTQAQDRCVREIMSDLASEVPMNRLLQGDVGSGKTVVGVAALLIAVDGGAQAAFMVPTEILAQQHFFRLKAFCAGLDVRVDLLTGALSQSVRRKTREAIASGETRIVVGTHAIFGEKISFKELGLVIVDEQHRFGVLQKNALLAKTRSPHVLVMTATPIPRTLTLSIYGDLDVSLLDELPPGRKPVKTHRLDFSRAQQARLLNFVRDTARRGRQIYWVCPLIEESEKLDVTAAYSRFQNLREELPGLKIALLHGQLPPDEKEAVMADFAAGQTDLLVATSVVEVGVDVPNATVMVIEDAVRFGAAQLHQLRGRVGRGGGESHCILLAGKTTPESAARLNALLSMSDGFKIAEMDLRQRGPGEVCGVRQHGVTDFRVADLVRDRKLLELARREASALVEKDPELQSARPLAEALMSRLGPTLDLAGTA
ncbi:MAG: ATP-dependent DNA helicase RecG [Synergistaceae bacterium]|jgi:ATP-dependent DNA helicase RecG|nr:ATP-dependent DNA helicase RecG [Synergistaceae bacterium]